MVGDVYSKLAAKLGYPDSSHLRKILEKLVSPGDGELLLSLPASDADLARRFHKSEEEIDQKRQDLLRRGLVIISPRGMDFHHAIMGLWGASIPVAPELRDPAVYEIWKDWYEGGWHRDLLTIFGKDGPGLRVIPAWKSIEALSQGSPGQVVPQDNIRQLIYDAQVICAHDCDCRLPLGNCCDHPMETCFQFDNGAEYNLSRGAGRKISADETIAILDACEENGLVHQTYNRWPAGRAASLCNCCAETCLIHNSGLRNNSLDTLLLRSRFQAVVDTELCTGCQNCLDRCNYGAIEMVRVPGSKRMKAQVDPAKCWGCGLCTITCEDTAIRLEMARPDNIPGWGPEIERDRWEGEEAKGSAEM